MPGAGRARPVAVAALLCPLAIGAADFASAQQPNLDAYESRIAVYRSGEFGLALRASRTFPIDRLEDQAEEYLDRLQGRAPEYDRRLLAAAMLHFDLAWAAGMEPEENERIGRRLLGRVTDARRDTWIRESHLGLLGAYVDGGRFDHATRMAVFLDDSFPSHPAVKLHRARLAEFIGWSLHDERFFDQAQASYESLLTHGVGDPVELRLRIAHLTLRAGNPEAALEGLDTAGPDRSAIHRFISLLLRGEILLWLDEARAAETAFAEAQAVHVGSVSAAAGLAVARQTLGEGKRASEAVRSFLAGTNGQDAWWRFLVQPIADEVRRLDGLRALAVQPEK